MGKKHMESFKIFRKCLINLWTLLKGISKKHQVNIIGKKETSGFKFSIFDSIEFVPAEIWNSINSENNIFLCVDYLKALEKAPPKNMAFKYTILYKNSKPSAIAYFQILSLSVGVHERMSEDKTISKEKLSDKVHSKMKENMTSKMLICGNVLLSGENGFAAVSGLDQTLLSKGISEAIERIRHVEKISGKVNIILIKDFYSEKKYNSADFTDIGYYEYFAGPNMVVPIRENWLSFNDYLINMNPKYRRKVNGVLKKGEGLIRKSLSLEEIVENKNELYSLYLQVVNKSKFRLFVLNPDMFQELKRFLKENFVLDAYYLKDRIVAYTTRIFNGDVMEGYSHGLDYVLNKQYDIYLNILLDDIKTGISNKIKKVNFGRTSIAMKSSLGAVPADMKFLMQFKVIIPNQLIKWISFFFRPLEEHCRSPFN